MGVAVDFSRRHQGVQKPGSYVLTLRETVRTIIPFCARRSAFNKKLQTFELGWVLKRREKTCQQRVVAAKREDASSGESLSFY